MSQKLSTEREHAALARAAAGSLLSRSELAAILRMSPDRFRISERLGDFARFRVKQPVGKYCYSGVLVHRHVTGDAVYVPTFGRTRSA